MKGQLSTVIALLILSTAISARPPHERGMPQDMVDSIQVGKITAAMLNSLDRDIYKTQKAFDKEISNVGDANDYVEGKIQAGMITLVGDELLRIQEERANLEDKSEIVDADVNPLHDRLEELRKIIDEINL